MKSENLNSKSEGNPTSEFRSRPEPSPGGLPKRLSAFCIYTIRRSSDLDERFKEGGTGTFTEQKEWKSGMELLDEARATGKELPIIFAAGESIAGLAFWAIITDLRVEPGRTTYSFERLTRIKSEPPLSLLKVRSTGDPLPNNFIRPYAICHTPFLLRCTRSARHFVAYHNIDLMGCDYNPDSAEGFGFFSRKRRAFLEKSVSASVWVVTGKVSASGGKQYRLAAVYEPSEIFEERDGFDIRGEEDSGFHFSGDPLELNELPWFQDLLKEQNHFREHPETPTYAD